MTYNGNPLQLGLYQEPAINKTRRGVVEGRWRWWYSSIADLMIRNPDWTQQQIAASLNKHPNTITMIVGTDLFREFLAQRKAAFRADHDFALNARLTNVATEGLDIILDQLRTKKTQIPLQAALKITESALDRLGYAPASSPQVVVDQRTIDNRQQTMVSLTPADLEDARMAMRLAERSKAGSSTLEGPLTERSAPLEACGAGHDAIDVDVSDVGGQP